VRHDDQVRCLQPNADRRNQRVIQVPKVSVRRRLQLLADRADKRGPQTELRELELQQPHVIAYLRDWPERYDLERVSPEDADVGLSPGLVVLEESGVVGQARADLFDAG
jgi:hypothetical protein